LKPWGRLIRRAWGGLDQNGGSPSWAKFIGPIPQVMVRGIKKVDQVFLMAMAAYNLVRMRTLGQIRLEVA
jgi:hypothetical protein